MNNKNTTLSILSFSVLSLMSFLFAPSAHAQESKTTVSIVENSTNIQISTAPVIDNSTQSIEIAPDENRNQFENINDSSIVETTDAKSEQNNYMDEGFTNSAASPIHNLEFTNAPVYYSSDCGCQQEDTPAKPYDAAPIATPSSPLLTGGPTFAPVIADVIAGAILPTNGISLLVLALFGNIMMLLLRSYLRLRSGRSPGITYPLVTNPHFSY